MKVLVGSFPTYGEAQRVVDTLSDNDFPVERVQIVGSDLRLVEQVVARMTVGRAAVAGLMTGAWFGFFIGLIFWIVTPWAASAIVTGVLLGMAFGAVYAAVAHALTRGSRDFASVRRIEAGRYDVLVDGDYAERALRILGLGSAYPQEVPAPRSAATRR